MYQTKSGYNYNPNSIRQKSVGAIILNAEQKVLLVFSTANEYWEFPKGKMERGEKELDTLKREIYEETGIKHFRLQPLFKEQIYYNFRVNELTIAKLVVYYLFKTGANVQLSDEHTKFQWVSLNEAAGILKHINQRNLIKRVQQFLIDHPFNTL
ncbi:MAG: NUDIX domain-containing protein [Patescibacteria group bacterium]|jgi:8-oxo-dGTP pyrophosphatase MutT (NUDIX family)